MAHIVETRIDTPAAELRDLLDRAERQLPTLTADQLGDYLSRLDRLDALFGEAAAGADLRPEWTRWEDLQSRLQARAGALARLASSAGGFAALRAAHPPATGAWWHLDEMAAANRRSGLKRLLIGLVAVVAVLAVLAFVYQRWFAPSPEVVAAVSATNKVEQLVQDQQFDAALAAAQEALQRMPDNSDLLMWVGVLTERTDAVKAAPLLARAEQAIGDPVRYNVTLAMKRLQAGEVDLAEQAAQAALQANPQEPQAVFMLANVAEMRGDSAKAIDLYQQTADLAENANPQLVVISKMRLGMLLQQMNTGMGAPAEQPTSPPGTPAQPAPAQPAP